MLDIWSQPSGYDFGTFLEQLPLNVPLPVTSDPLNVFQIISGSLPGGLQLVADRIVGNPYIVANIQSYQFCIRVSKGIDFSDRTFTMKINGLNAPVFVTNPGTLDVGPSKQFYALDGSYISYQIEATDLITATGVKLKYFISSNDGKLPPGLEMSEDGLISGFVNSNLIITPSAGTGEYDQSYYDLTGYDFALIPTDGFDSYKYDNIYFDYNRPASLPKSLNANYQFKVTVSDGITVAQRIFKIFIVGNDQFRADSTSLDGFAGQFTADSTFLRTPVWLSKANLGTFRANNYLTVPVALYDNSFALFRLETTNCEIYATTKRLTLPDNVIGKTKLTIVNPSAVPVTGQYLTFNNYIDGATEKVYQIFSVVSLGNSQYRLTLTSPLLINVPDLTPFYIGTLSELPLGTKFDVTTGEIYGVVPYQPSITRQFKFTITATRIDIDAVEKVISNKTFSINILGTITSQITWDSDTDLGIISAGYPSTISIKAHTNLPDTTLLYSLVSGTLPNGLELKNDGEITGVPVQFYNPSNGEAGLTTFDNSSTRFDFGKTTVDRSFTFKVKVNDQFQYSAITKEFTINLITPDAVPYSNIITQPFLKPSQRSEWQSFVNNSSIFDLTSIYRPTDTNFGIQKNLKMLVYAGIQTESALAYIGAMGLGFKRKQFKFGDIKVATAVDPSSRKDVYETIYIQMLDPLEPNGKHLPLSVTFTNSLYSEAITVDSGATDSVRPVPLITIDSTGYEVSNPKTNMYFPNSISNWQERLENTVDNTYGTVLTERNHLPLWMRSIPLGSKQELGYVLCVPLAFCKPGKSITVLNNIKASGFDFKTLDYTVDRFTISAVTGYTSDKYLIFRDDRITV